MNAATQKVDKWLKSNPGYWMILGAFANEGGAEAAVTQLIGKACDEGAITAAEMTLVERSYFANDPQLKKWQSEMDGFLPV